MLALLLELCSYTTTMSYNFVRGYSYLSYLEYPVLLVQEYVLIYSVLKYSNLLNSRSVMYSLLYVTVAGLFLTQIISPVVLTMMLVSLDLDNFTAITPTTYKPFLSPLSALVHTGRSHK